MEYKLLLKYKYFPILKIWENSGTYYAHQEWVIEDAKIISEKLSNDPEIRDENKLIDTYQ